MRVPPVLSSKLLKPECQNFVASARLALPVELAFLKASSVPVSNSRSAWFGVATSGMLVFISLLVWV